MGSSGLTDQDGAAISKALRILTEAGYTVDGIGTGSRYHAGVEFTLEVQAPDRMGWFEKQSEAVKEAAIDAPEFGMGGQEVTPDGE